MIEYFIYGSQNLKVCSMKSVKIFVILMIKYIKILPAGSEN